MLSARCFNLCVLVTLLTIAAVMYSQGDTGYTNLLVPQFSLSNQLVHPPPREQNLIDVTKTLWSASKPTTLHTKSLKAGKTATTTNRKEIKHSLKNRTMAPKPQDKYFERSERCQPFPPPHGGGTWLEDPYVNDSIIQDVSIVASGPKSKMVLIGSHVVPLGATVKVRITLYDRSGRLKTIGGDLIRVWVKNPSLNASSTADVSDHGNGSYTASLSALWVGKSSIMAAVVMAREHISAIMRRRLLCPPTLFDQAVFKNGPVRTSTPCSTRPYIVGYQEICNLTDSNFGSSWYCGKPRHPGVNCSHWRLVSDVNMFKLGLESKVFQNTEYQLLHEHHGPDMISTDIKLNVTSGNTPSRTIQPSVPCSKQGMATTWNLASPTGYMYNRKWIDIRCKQNVTSSKSLQQCLRNTSILIVGDSTGRQMFDSISRLSGSSVFSKNAKHGGNNFRNETLDLNVVTTMHELPFCTTNNDHNFFQPFRERVRFLLKKNIKTVVVLHMFSHFMPYHSYVFHSRWTQTKVEIISFLEKNPDVHIIIKGPHTYAFRNEKNKVTTFVRHPDCYAEMHSKMLHNIFQRLHERLYYLNAYDITVATEQFFIHAEDYIIDELVFNMLSYIC